MSPRHGRRNIASWIALVAMMMVAFMPTLSSAFPASGGLPWERICSASNVMANKGRTPVSPASTHAFEHCPYCALHADLAPPPDPRQADAGIAFAFRAVPLAFARAPRCNAVWASAQPRAPPRLV